MMIRALAIPCLTILALLAPAPATLAAQDAPTDASIAAEPAAADGPLEGGPLRELLARYAPGAMEAADVPGAAVAVVHRGEVVLLEGFGLADLEAAEPVDPERTVFRFGSISKPLTASAILALLERVDFGLDRDVRPLLGPLDLRPEYPQPLTLRQLLTQTAGFNEHLFVQHAARAEEWTALEPFLVAHLPPRFAPPGEVVGYGDFHTSLAGYVAGKLALAPFEELAERRLLEPLGLRDTTFRQVDLPAALTSRLARSYGRRQGERFPYERDYIHTTPAAGVQGTAADMARYLIALLDEGAPGTPGATVMSPASWREQKTIHQRHHEKVRGKGLGLTEVTHGGRSLLYKDGQASGFHARFVLVPEERLGLFSVHNRSIIDAMGAFNAASRFNRELIWEVLDAVLPPIEREPLPEPTPLPGFARRAPAYEGHYRTTIASRHTIEKLIAMMDSVEVRRDGDRILFGGGAYVEVEPGLFQWYEGARYWVAFSAPPGETSYESGRSEYLYVGAGAFERIPWYESPKWTHRFALLFLSFFLLAAAVFVRQGWWGPEGGRGAARLGLLVAALDLGFLAAFAAVMATADIQHLFHGWPWTMKAALALPLLSAIPLAALAWSVSAADRRRAAGRLTSATAALTVVAGAGYLWWLSVWNLLGWRL